MSRHRGNKRRSRRDEWADEGPSDFQEPNFFSRLAEGGKPDPEADVLWFNVPKGFGSVQPAVGDKAFLHIKQLEAAGLSEIDEDPTEHWVAAVCLHHKPSRACIGAGAGARCAPADFLNMRLEMQVRLIPTMGQRDCLGANR